MPRQLQTWGHTATIISGGLDCAEQLRAGPPDILLVEAPLNCCGTEAVLEIAQRELSGRRIPVILAAVGMGSIDWFQLSRYWIDDILFRLPTVRELERAITGITKQRPADAAEPSRMRATSNPRHNSGSDS